MDMHKKQIIDFTECLPNANHETFCREYVRLDLEEKVVNKSVRRIMAYRNTFPESKTDERVEINKRALTLLRRADVSGRIKHLYDEEGSSVENEYNWTKSKAEDVLIEILFGEGCKNGDKLNAIKQLNQMRGIDVPKVEQKEDEGGDTLKSFFKQFGGEKGAQ